MPWLIALISLVTGYFLILAAMVWSAYRTKIDGDRPVLVLIFKNAEASAEAVMWDLFRLKSWDYLGLSFLVIDDNSDDDTLLILKKMRKKYPFLLISAPCGKRFQLMLQGQGKKVRVLHVTGSECPRLVRKRMLYLLKHSCDDRESHLRKYSEKIW